MPCVVGRVFLASLTLALMGFGTKGAWAKPPARGKVTAYPVPAGVAPDPDFKVSAEGKDVFVFTNPFVSIASFDFTGGPIEVVITSLKRDIKWVDVRPRSAGVKAAFTDNTIRFSLATPANLSIELNGAITRRPLFLFANPPEEKPPLPTAKGVHYFGPGKVHSPGWIDVKSGDTVYVAGGAIVEGSISGDAVENVTIRGRGILDGTRLRQVLGLPERPPGPRPAANRDAGAPGPQPGQPRWRRPHFIGLRDCKNVRIEGLTLSNGPTWEVVPTNCDGLTITNLKIASDNGGDDGIDLVRSRNVTIERAFIHTKDDNIAIKAVGNYPPELGVRNIRVRKSVFWNALWGNALEIGFELRSAFVEDIVFEDSDVIHVENGAVFSIHNGDGSTVRNVRFENIRVEDARQSLIDVAIFLTQYSLDRPKTEEERTARYLHGAWDGVLSVVGDEQRKLHAPGRGRVENVVFKNIAILDGLLPFSIVHGYDADHRVDGLVIDNLTFAGRKLTSPEEAHMRINEHATVRFVP